MVQSEALAKALGADKDRSGVAVGATWEDGLKVHTSSSGLAKHDFAFQLHYE